MKNIGKLAVLGAVLAASASFAFADSITLGSYGSAGLSGYAPVVTGVANTEVVYAGSQQFTSDTTGCPAGQTYCLPAFSFASLSSSTAIPPKAVDIDPTGAWNGNTLSNSSWVGINQYAGPNSTKNPEYGYYEFTTTIDNLATGYDGTLNLMADDTTAVYLTNSAGTDQLILSMGALGDDSHCANLAPTCLATDSVGLDLLAGDNTLTFIVEQAGSGPYGGTGDPSGLNFNATLSATPEPSSLLLLGTGLFGAAGAFLRKRVTA